MKKTGVKIMALTLAMVLLLTPLSGCKKNEDEGNGGADGGGSGNGNGTGASLSAEYTYVPEYITMPEEMSEFDSSTLCYYDGAIYFTRTIYDYGEDFEPRPDIAGLTEPPADDTDTPDDTVPDDDTAAGGGDVPEDDGMGTDGDMGMAEYDYTPPEVKMYRMNIDGTGLTELTAFEATQIDEGKEGNSYISRMVADADGNLWLVENLSYYHFTDSGDYVEDGNFVYFRVLDNTGAEIKRMDVTSIFRVENQEYYYGVSYFAIDADGNIYASGGESGVYVLDGEGKLLFKVDTPENGWINGMVKLGDGTVGVAMYDQGNPVLKSIDAAKRDWGESYTMNTRTYNYVDGNAEYGLYSYDENNLYGFDLGAKENVKLLNWIGSDINSNYIQVLAPLPDGRIFVITQGWNYDNDGGPTVEMILLTKKDASEIEQKTVLTMACLYIDYTLRGEIIAFNKTNGKYRIEVNDYSQYNDYNSENEDDWNAGLTRLTTEIISGNVPDILSTSELPIQQYAAKGLLEDLYPYIDSDPDLSRDDFVQSVLRALEVDGKLYQTASTFSVQTVVGDPRVVGYETGWTIDELMALMATMPAGTQAFAQTTKEWMLQSLCYICLGDYVDWQTGKCSFDSDDFIKLLEFANTFPAEYEWSEDQPELPDLIMDGKVLLNTYYASDMGELQMYKAMFGGEIVFKGFPSPTRNGHVLNISTGLAMSSKCSDKEGAWEFMRMLMSREYQESDNMWSFPTNKYALEAKMEKAMEKDTYIDENGEEVEASKGGYGWGNLMVDIYASTQEEVDMIMELINSAENVATYDSAMMEIILEEAQAYFSGSKTARDVAALIQSRVSIYVNEQR